MSRISRKITERAKKAARKEIDIILNDEGYMTREELGKKYNLNPLRIYRWTKKGLKHDPELRRIKESDFVKFMKENPISDGNRIKIKK